MGSLCQFILGAYQVYYITWSLENENISHKAHAKEYYTLLDLDIFSMCNKVTKL